MRKALDEDEAMQPLGLSLARQAEGLEIPFAIVTSENHHGALVQKPYDYMNTRGWRLEDNARKESSDYWVEVMERLGI